MSRARHFNLVSPITRIGRAKILSSDSVNLRFLNIFLFPFSILFHIRCKNWSVKDTQPLIRISCILMIGWDIRAKNQPNCHLCTVCWYSLTEAPV